MSKKASKSQTMSKEASTKEEETSPSFFSLPEAVASSCLARVSRADHAAFSLVSKRCRSLVTSSELYKTRLLMGQTKKYPYVCLSYQPYSAPLWLIFSVKPRDFGPELLPIPSLILPSQPHSSSTFVSLDCWIYVIGGIRNDARTSDVWRLDCRYNTWRQVSSMGVARASAAAEVVDEKIYVFGGCEDTNSSNWAEVFDPESQTWDTLVPMVDRNDDDNSIRQTFVMDEKIYAVDVWDKCFYYSPSEGKWGRTKAETQRFCCVIDNVLYGCDSFGNIFWRKSVDLEWKKVKGLEALRKNFPPSGVRAKTFETRVRAISHFDSTIGVYWIGPPKWCEIWCAEISLERRGGANEVEIWGTMGFSDAVAILGHDEAEFLYSVTVNV